MSASSSTRTGLRASAVSALASVVMPGTGNWFIRARMRGAVLWCAALNAAAMIVVIVIGMRMHSRTDLAALLADRTRVIGLYAAWQARPATGGS